MNRYQNCIEACLQCAVACAQCATACTQEKDIKMMAACIRLDMECEAICRAAAEMMSHDSAKSKEICRICADICNECGKECAKHQMDHCQKCAEACRKCAEACLAM
jgi:hypothetical protein